MCRTPPLVCTAASALGEEGALYSTSMVAALPARGPEMAGGAEQRGMSEKNEKNWKLCFCTEDEVLQAPPRLARCQEGL